MTATLVSIFGPLKGSVFALSQPEVSIGRDISNSISIIDPLLSRTHCVIRKEGEDFRIIDLNSRNGIFVNDVPTSGAVLRHGDEVEMGDSMFIFLQSDSVETSGQLPLDKDLIGTSTLELRPENALYVPDRLMKARQWTDRAVHDLGVLLKISSVIHSIRDLESLQEKLMQLAFEVIPAERGAILLGVENDIATGYATDSNFAISQNIAKRAIQERTAILSSDSGTASILCVPLLSFEDVIGALYFETSSSFDDFHLQLAWGIAPIAAVALKNAIERKQLLEENEKLQAGAALNMVGESKAIQSIHELVLKIASKDSTVLICGESGTGKELIARAIHRNSPRSRMPFVAINCASLTDTLLESELFGHEKGAFTGAISQKRGKLEIADGGTVFLDEISETALTVQPKLLRVIQEREFERLGGTRPIKVNVRFLAATNRNLEQAIRMGNFRQDLYYRLNVIRIDVPPLRERSEDIPLLAKYFVSKFSKTLQRRVKGVSPEAMECLLQHDWPGNVRELENLMERAVALGSIELILPEDLPDSLVENAPKISSGFIQSVKETKKRLVMNALQKAGGNYAEAAEILGVHPNYLYRLLRSLGIKN